MSGIAKAEKGGVSQAGDQRNVPASEEEHADRYHEGKENSHILTDSSKKTPCPAGLFAIGIEY